MNARSRRQTRQRRTGGWPPEQHNESMRRRKELIRFAKRHAELSRGVAVVARAFAAFAAQAAAQAAEQIRRELALAVDAEVQRRIEWADLMSTRGFDMRDEHEALERGELVD